MTSSRKLFTCPSPALLPLYDFQDSIVVVVDIFRATSTICAALDHGALAVHPVDDVEICKSFGQDESYITGGERRGHIVPGLQYGNSPLDYTADVVQDKILALTTTNGVRLLHKVKESASIIIGSFLNLDAVCDYLLQQDKNILLACAGWLDKINVEDLLFCGAVIDQIGNQLQIECDSSQIAHSLWLQAQQEESIYEFLKKATHFHRLESYGVGRDLVYCSQLNTHPIVPVYKEPWLVVE